MNINSKFEAYHVKTVKISLPEMKIAFSRVYFKKTHNIELPVY